MNAYEKFETIGNIWIKNNFARLYLNEKTIRAIGYDWERYNTGNICYATLDGQKISNSEMKRVMLGVDKMFIDLKTGKMMDGTRFVRREVEMTDDVRDRIMNLFNRINAA